MRLGFGNFPGRGHRSNVVNDPPDLLGSFPAIVGGHAAFAFQNEKGKFAISEMRKGFRLPPIMEVHVDILGLYSLAISVLPVAKSAIRRAVQSLPFRDGRGIR